MSKIVLLCIIIIFMIINIIGFVYAYPTVISQDDEKVIFDTSLIAAAVRPTRSADPGHHHHHYGHGHYNDDNDDDYHHHHHHHHQHQQNHGYNGYNGGYGGYNGGYGQGNGYGNPYYNQGGYGQTNSNSYSQASANSAAFNTPLGGFSVSSANANSGSQSGLFGDSFK